MANRFKLVSTDLVSVDMFNNDLKKYVIHVDTETGVQYLSTGYNSSGITVLLDKDGKPLLHPYYPKKR